MFLSSIIWIHVTFGVHGGRWLIIEFWTKIHIFLWAREFRYSCAMSRMRLYIRELILSATVVNIIESILRSKWSSKNSWAFSFFFFFFVTPTRRGVIFLFTCCSLWDIDIQFLSSISYQFPHPLCLYFFGRLQMKNWRLPLQLISSLTMTFQEDLICGILIAVMALWFPQTLIIFRGYQLASTAVLL